MRKIFCLIVLAACELRPAPKNKPAPVDPPPAEKVAEAPPAPAPAAGSGSAAQIQITPQCLEVGAKVAQVFIDAATDPAQKSIYEQERANMTRKTGEACTTQAWSDDARKCYLATKTPAEIKACETKYPTPIRVEPVQPAAQPQPGTAPRPEPTVVIPPPAQPRQRAGSAQ